MANWCEGTVKVAGDAETVARLAVHINGILEDISDPKTDDKRYCLKFASVDATASEDAWVLLGDHVKAENGTMTFRYEGKWTPPVPGFVAISRAYPALAFDLGYSVEGMWDAGNWHIENGGSDLTKHYRGYFSLASEGQPVHHRVLGLNNPLARKALVEANLTVPAEAVADNEVGIRDRADVESLMDRHFPNEQVYLLSYTLDEETYLDSVQTLASETRRYLSESELQRMVRVAERDIRLTADEVVTLTGVVHPDRQWPTLKLDHRIPAILFFNAVESARIREYLTGWKYVGGGGYVPADSPDFFPTAKEIRLLLDKVSEPRRAELEAALSNPKWSREWPLWEIQKRIEEERQSRTVQNTDVLGDDDFMKELESMQ